MKHIKLFEGFVNESTDTPDIILKDFAAMDLADNDLDLSDITDRVHALSDEDFDLFVAAGVKLGLVNVDSDNDEDGWAWVNPETKEIFESYTGRINKNVTYKPGKKLGTYNVYENGKFVKSVNAKELSNMKRSHSRKSKDYKKTAKP